MANTSFTDDALQRGEGGQESGKKWLRKKWMLLCNS